MKTIAQVAYHLAFHNAFNSFLQIVDHGEEDESTFDQVNCINKEKCLVEKVAELSTKYDIIQIVTTNNTKRLKLDEKIQLALQKLNNYGVILFDFANVNKAEDAECWQEVARLRCKDDSFICVIPQVAHGCAVFRPGLKSHLYATNHLPQYDKFEYLQSNRIQLLNIMSDEEFLTLVRFI